VLASSGLDALDRVEVAVLADERCAECRDEPTRVAPSSEIRHDELARLVDLLLAVEKARQRVEQRSRVRSLLRHRQPRRGHVQEPVEMDTHRCVENTTQELL
jgi:hypothetical protein